MSDEQRKNLLSGTRDWSGSWVHKNLWRADGTHDGFAVMSREGSWYGLHKQVMLVAGQTYTFSACVRVEPGENHHVMLYFSNGQTVNDNYLANSEFDKPARDFSDVADGGWHVISHTFTAKASKYALPRVEAGGRYVLSVCAYMLVEGDTPAAWAPADGEDIAGGGGVSMSANLLASVETLLLNGARRDGDEYVLPPKTNTNHHDDALRWNFSEGPFTSNQTIHLGFSAKGVEADSDSLVMIAGYSDAAGNTNWIRSGLFPVTTDWKRFDASVVVPSGMTVFRLAVAIIGTSKEIRVASPTMSLGESTAIAGTQETVTDITDAYNVILTSEAYTFPGTTSTAKAASATTQVIAMRGNAEVGFSIGTITCPTGVTATKGPDGKTITITSSTLMKATGDVLIPITPTGSQATIVKRFSCGIAFTGTTGAKGDKGDKGETGAQVTSVTTWYIASTSKPSQPTVMEPSGWSQTQPALDVTKTTTLYECQRTVLSTGSFMWGQVNICSDYAAAKAAYDKAVSLDNSLNATGVFNRLTNNGKEQGIYRGDDGHLYINATYIKTGQLTANLLRSGMIVSNDGNVVFDLTSGDIYSFDSNGNGFVFKDGTLQLTTHSIFDSSGDPAYGVIERMTDIFGIDGVTVAGSSGVGIGTKGANADRPVPNIAVGDMSGFFLGGNKDGNAWLNVGQTFAICFGKIADGAKDSLPPHIFFGSNKSGTTEAGSVAFCNIKNLDIVANTTNFSGSVSMSTPLPVGSGGTGSTSASAARSALGAASKLDCWPVGSVYISFSTTSPASLFGGTWVRLTDVFLYATASSAPSTTPVGSHSRTFTAAQMPKHAHGFKSPVMEWGTKWTTDAVNVGSLSSASWKTGGWNGSDHSGSQATTTAYAGSGNSVNIAPRYVSVFAWRRTA